MRTTGNDEPGSDYQAQAATRFAGRTFKRLMHHTCERLGRLLPEVTEALDAFELGLRSEQDSVERTALTLYEAGENELARKYLTAVSTTAAVDGLDLGEALLGSIEARTKVLYGIRAPEQDDINATFDEQTVNCLVGSDPDLPPDAQ